MGFSLPKAEMQALIAASTTRTDGALDAGVVAGGDGARTDRAALLRVARARGVDLDPSELAHDGAPAADRDGSRRRPDRSRRTGGALCSRRTLRSLPTLRAG